MRMVEFDVRINKQQGTAYIPKEIRKCLGTELKAVPNRFAVLLYCKDLSTQDVIRSLLVIKQDLEHCVELEKSQMLSKGVDH